MRRRRLGFRRSRLLLSCVAGLVLPGPLLGQTVAEVCGDSPAQAPRLEVGRWLPLATGDGHELSSSIADPIFDRLGTVLELFQAIPALRPPMGVELRPSRSIRSVGRRNAATRVVHSWLLIQVFHPTLEVAGEASASVRVEVNSLTPLLYDAAGPVIGDSVGPIFLEPLLVGEVSGNRIYQTHNTACVAVLKAHDRPLWLPVSQERFLRAQIADIRGKSHEADSTVSEALAEQREADKEIDEMIRRLRATDPAAADKLERDIAVMRQEAEAGVGQMNELTGGWIGELEAQLAAMSPAERARPAYLTGGGKGLELLADPGEEGARALVAPNAEYFDADDDLTAFQLLTVRMSDVAEHPPETTIIDAVRRGLNWEALGRFLGNGSTPR